MGSLEVQGSVVTAAAVPLHVAGYMQRPLSCPCLPRAPGVPRQPMEKSWGFGTGQPSCCLIPGIAKAAVVVSVFHLIRVLVLVF